MYKKVFFTIILTISVMFELNHSLAQGPSNDACSIWTKALMEKSTYSTRQWRISKRWVHNQENLQNKISLAIDEQAKEKIIYVLSALRLKMPKATSEEIMDEYNELFTRCL